METTVVRTSDPRELVVYAEHVLGFRPADSLVVVSLRGPRGRAGLVLRLDLVDAARDGAAEQMAARFAADGALLAAVHVHGSAPVRPRSRLDGLPHARTARTWRRALAARGVGDGGSWLVTGGRMRSYTCPRSCCQPEGLLLDRAATRTGAEMVLAGSSVAADRETWSGLRTAALAPAPAADRRPVEAAARRWQQGWPAPHASSREGAAEVASWWARSLAVLRPLVEAAADALDVDGGPGRLADAVGRLMTPAATGRLLAALDDHDLRDALIATVEPACADHLVGPPTISGAGPAAAVSGTTPPPPGTGTDTDAGADDPDDPSRTGAAEHLLRAAVRLATGARRSEPLALLAWLAWWRGEGVDAALHAELALRADPGHRLAALVLRAAENAVPARPRGGTAA